MHRDMDVGFSGSLGTVPTRVCSSVHRVRDRLRALNHAIVFAARVAWAFTTASLVPCTLFATWGDTWTSGSWHS